MLSYFKGRYKSRRQYFEGIRQMSKKVTIGYDSEYD
jgi:hypothetical protein